MAADPLSRMRSSRQTPIPTPYDTELEAAQAALLARYAPHARIQRVRWSGGETQALELGAGPPLLLIHGGLASGFYWAQSSQRSLVIIARSSLICLVMGWPTRSIIGALICSAMRAHSWAICCMRSSCQQLTSWRTRLAGCGAPPSRSLRRTMSGGLRSWAPPLESHAGFRSSCGYSAFQWLDRRSAVA